HVNTYARWSAAAKSNYIKKITSSTFKPQKKCQENLINWCTKPMLQDQQAKIDKKLLDAVVYSNLPFKIIENPYMIKFLNELASNYKPPSTDILSSKVLNNSFLAYLEKKFEIIKSITDLTIALDGWQNISRNSIYSFITLKENQEYVLDIINLLSN
ncbi:18070_t:CDS:2, partial [Cetraspora pellucida]